ncbi:U6 snRNA-associated Sm-like protein LSm7 [Tupaia chinensis]|uniref:U6 snRNA-associated Sm-like protein LSm7 n=1 Tax=Tupaia chinensis TaxID=246437 RepID=L9LD86_TUPCH|nr:U6 snRNA-associated Sm-like protein LSm7 [Tupaia chinensis]
MVDKEKKKESILDLSKYMDKTICMKFQGGREASGTLKGFDPLPNLLLNGTIKYMRDLDDQYKLTDNTQQLGWWCAGVHSEDDQNGPRSDASLQLSHMLTEGFFAVAS